MRPFRIAETSIPARRVPFRGSLGDYTFSVPAGASGKKCQIKLPVVSV